MSAYSYLRAKSKPAQEDQLQVVAAYFRRFLEPAGVAWGRVLADVPDAGRKLFGQRPAGVKLIRTMDRGDHLVLPRISVAFRSVPDFLERLRVFETRGIELHLANVGLRSGERAGFEKMVLLAELAEQEREIDHEIGKLRYARCRAAGQAMGRPPIGFRHGGRPGHRRLVPDKVEQAAIRDIWSQAGDGRTIDAIFFDLLARRVRRRDGGEWTRTAVHRAVEIGERLFGESAAPASAAS